MDSSVSGKAEIWFMRVCHHVPHELYYYTQKEDIKDFERRVVSGCTVTTLSGWIVATSHAP